MGRNNLPSKPGPGRTPGTPDSVPRTVRASIRQIFQELGEQEPEIYKKAIRKGLQAGTRDSFPFVRLAAAYLDGVPAQTLRIEDENKLDLGALRAIFYEVETERQAAALDAGGDPELPEVEPKLLPAGGHSLSHHIGLSQDP